MKVNHSCIVKLGDFQWKELSSYFLPQLSMLCLCLPHIFSPFSWTWPFLLCLLELTPHFLPFLPGLVFFQLSGAYPTFSSLFTWTCVFSALWSLPHIFFPFYLDLCFFSSLELTPHFLPLFTWTCLFSALWSLPHIFSPFSWTCVILLYGAYPTFSPVDLALLLLAIWMEVARLNVITNMGYFHG